MGDVEESLTEDTGEAGSCPTLQRMKSKTMERGWRTVSPSRFFRELQQASPTPQMRATAALCAGLLDRVERLRRVYKAEIARR